MIEIVKGTLEERIIKLLQKKYPIDLKYIQQELKISEIITLRTLQKLQARGILALDPLPGKIYVRLLRNDFNFIGKKRQRKFIKRYKEKKQEEKKEYEGIMYT